MNYWVDIENANGVRLGDGPILSAQAWTHTARLDRAGTFSFTMAAAIPPLLLVQADVSEEMLELTTTVGEGNAIEAAGTKVLTPTHYIKATITGVGTVYIPCGTIAPP